MQMQMRSLASLHAPAMAARLAKGVIMVPRAAASTSGAKPPTKRTPSAYNLFLKSKYPQVKAEMVAAGVQAPEFGQISAKCSEQWGKLAGAAKAKFVDDAAAERMRLEAVWAAAPPATGKKIKRVSAPRASPPWTQYVKEQFAAVKASHPEFKLPEVTKQLSAQWKTMSTAAKAPYVQAYEKAKAELASKGAAGAPAAASAPPPHAAAPMRATSPVAKTASPPPAAASKAAAPKSVTPKKTPPRN